MKKPILLVEDNPDDVELTIRAFRKGNIINEVVVAIDGEKALELLLGDTPIVPSVVLLDLKLPKIDGLSVLKRIRDDKRTRLLPVVILTSSNEENDLVRGYELGANSYIRKPVDFNQFIRAVQTLGMYWLLLNQPPPEI
jgi:two-component system, response regulator